MDSESRRYFNTVINNLRVDIEIPLEKINFSSSEKAIQGIKYLKINHKGMMVLKDGRTINYGLIRKEESNLIIFTLKGLDEKLEGSEEELIELGNICIINMSEISNVLF